MTDDQKATYRRDGFVYCPDLLGAENARAMQDEVQTILGNPEDSQRTILEKDGQTPRTILNPQLWNPLFARLTRHPDLLDRATALLGEDVYAWQMGINCKQAFNGDIWFWHQDYPAYFIDDHIPTPRMVNVLIFLDDVNPHNGPLMMVPGSHRYEDKNPQAADEGTSYTFRYTDRAVIEAEVRRGGIEAPTGPAGSVIFMDVNTLHGSAANLSPWPRRLITLTMNAISNTSTTPSVRPRHIVPDDRDATPLQPLKSTSLLETCE
ncbi:phytanoyl-CoA dioxygenase family protein [Epibacterium sp. Ofav1-8]|nr:phytanoyl-CoA dioxygenase family protein [Epibacterium sp. Ofav1-8]